MLFYFRLMILISNQGLTSPLMGDPRHFAQIIPGGTVMKTITVTELRGNIYNLLDEVLNTGIPIEINKGGKKLKIVPVCKVNKLQNLVSRPNVIKGNPDDLVDIIVRRK